MQSERQALVGIPACYKLLGRIPYHCVGDKYLRVVTDGLDGVPLLVPALGDKQDLRTLVSRLDGLLIPGSPSNVEPHHYDGPPSGSGTLHDPYRDATTLPLIQLAVAEGVPILAICRGIQELNVAFGGSLHQEVHKVPGLSNHREDLRQPVAVQYGPSHKVKLTAGGFLAQLLGEDEIMVNSLHGQGINRLADACQVEARAPDGLIEAITVKGSKSFSLGVQWHPEWQFQLNPISLKIFAAFSAAILARRESRG